LKLFPICAINYLLIDNSGVKGLDLRGEAEESMPRTQVARDSGACKKQRQHLLTQLLLIN